MWLLQFAVRNNYKCCTTIRLRLHLDNQSKNGEMYLDSTPSFLLFKLLRFGPFTNGMWACHFLVSMLALAHTYEPAKDTLIFFDRCHFRARASILSEYDGRDLVISKVCIRFWCLHECFPCLHLPSLRFQKCSFQASFQRMRVNKRPKRRQMSAFLSEIVFV